MSIFERDMPDFLEKCADTLQSSYDRLSEKDAPDVGGVILALRVKADILRKRAEA